MAPSGRPVGEHAGRHHPRFGQDVGLGRLPAELSPQVGHLAWLAERTVAVHEGRDVVDVVSQLAVGAPSWRMASRHRPLR